MPRIQVRQRNRTSIPFLRISADQTPMAMVKLETISTAGVRRAPADVQLVRGLDEGRIVPVAHDQVGGEEPAEEHDFGEQEEPHGEVGGVELLVDGLEVVALIGRMLVMSFRHGAVRQLRCYPTLATSFCLLCSPATRSRRLRDP